MGGSVCVSARNPVEVANTVAQLQELAGLPAEVGRVWGYAADVRCGNARTPYLAALSARCRLQLRIWIEDDTHLCCSSERLVSQRKAVAGHQVPAPAGRAARIPMTPSRARSPQLARGAARSSQECG